MIDWGPAASWAGAAATVLVAITTSLVASGFFDRFRAPRIRLTFDRTQPWCRRTTLADGRSALWVRVGVENTGRAQASGCVGRVMGATTDGERRADVDPAQLRWAGVPHSRAFDPIDIRPGQREYLDVVYLPDGDIWKLETFDDPDFDAGFAREFDPRRRHELPVAVFAANGRTATTTLILDPLSHTESEDRIVRR